MKKQNIFKAILFTILAFVVLTWLIPTGTASGTEIISQGLQRVGLYDLVEYPLVSMEFFANAVLLILGVGAFYGVLSKSSSYAAGVNKLAKSLRGIEKVVLVGVTILFALLTSVCGFSTLAFMIIPFFVTLLIAVGYDRMTAFLATFGATLMANIGSIWNINVNGYINGYLSVTYDTNLIAKVALLVVPMVIYVFFVLKYADSINHKKNKKDSLETEDVFNLNVEKKKTNSTAVMVLLGLLLVVLVLAVTPWNEVFQIPFFVNLTEKVLGIELFGHEVFSYVLGNFPAFGEYVAEESLALLAIGAIVIALVSKMNFNDVVDGAVLGLKKMVPVAITVSIAYSVLVLAIYYPIYPTIEGWLINLVPNFNVGAIFTVSLNTIIGSVLNVDPLYIAQQALPMMATAYAENTELMALIVQSMYGLTSLVAPTSIMLVMGLVYLEIPYTTWIKTAWKTILEILVIVLVIILALFFIA